MSAQQQVNANGADSSWIYRVGGIAGILFGIAYIIIIVLYVPMGAPPGGAAAKLGYVSANLTSWWAILGLSVFTDLLLVPVSLALYLSLKGFGKSVMLLAVAFMGLFIVLDLAVTWTNYAVLIALGGSYAAAADTQRAVLVAAAVYPSAILESNLLFVYNTLTLSVGILFAGLVMLRGIFGKAAAILGVATGILGIIAVISAFFPNPLSLTILLASVLTTVWVLFVGYKLVRLNVKP